MTNAPPTPQPEVTPCAECYGRGYRLDEDDEEYNCPVCDGTGKIFTPAPMSEDAKAILIVAAIVVVSFMLVWYFGQWKPIMPPTMQ